MTAEFAFLRGTSYPVPFAELTVGSDESRTVFTLWAQLDTGADRSVIPASLAEDLGLSVFGEAEFQTADGFLTTLRLYQVTLTIEPFEAELVTVAASENEPHMLLGRDVSHRFRVVLEGPTETLRIERD